MTEENPKCPKCNSIDIECIPNEDIAICYKCHQWFFQEEMKQ